MSYAGLSHTTMTDDQVCPIIILLQGWLERIYLSLDATVLDQRLELDFGLSGLDNDLRVSFLSKCLQGRRAQDAEEELIEVRRAYSDEGDHAQEFDSA